MRPGRAAGFPESTRTKNPQTKNRRLKKEGGFVYSNVETEGKAAIWSLHHIHFIIHYITYII